ncbi:MAG: hypothetical protein M1834_007704 [Cirrosporium novae-zelandiae]|nr:MAG: hypothetical protein M1834_007704 [Cirrosporium novae-zelandiae]
MSTSSTQSRRVHSRLNSLQLDGQLSRDGSRARKRQVSHAEAYSYALRVALLAHLLQPRSRRIQHVPAPQTRMHRSSTSINDLMRDFSIVRDSRSTRFPHGFVGELKRRLEGILLGRERRQEYQDALVKRTFATFFNDLADPGFKKRMEKDRRVEDLVLIFFSRATSELQKGKDPTDDSWKLMVDRHVALFVRIVILVLKAHDWSRDRPELTNRLATLESKLLKHDQDLTDAAKLGNASSSTTIEVVAPVSYDVEDMPLAQAVGRIFGLTNTQVQSDIDKNKTTWTEKAALQDLKAYQMYLNLNTKKTLRSEDFDLEDAYEVWRKAEGPDLSQMMLAIVQANPELAKATSPGALPQFQPSSSSPQSPSSDMTRTPLDAFENASSYVIDQPVDLSNLSLTDGTSEPQDDGKHPFTYIPPEPRTFYRFILAQVLSYDLKELPQSPEPSSANSTQGLLSKQSTELLNEICLRWRIPRFSRVVLFLDVVREKFVDGEIGLEMLEKAFNFVKEPFSDNKRSSVILTSVLLDRDKWTVADLALIQHILRALHDALLRELYEVMRHCYEPKPPSPGPILFLLDTHIYSDSSFPKSEEDLDAFGEQLSQGLREHAKEVYGTLLDKEVPKDQSSWEFYHVIQLGKAVMKLADRVQKRYRNSPEIMGVNPLSIFVETVLPLYAEDARDLTTRVIQVAQERGEEVAIEDGFDLYKELVGVRRIHTDALPGVPFAFHIEDLLANFVWRWINMTDEKLLGWIEEAVKQDSFQVRTDSPNQIPNEEQRHSVSVIDIFRSFNQTVNEVAQLEWDDDVQYAKFMTALAKSIGVGLSKYCDLLEDKFNREMDRLTPEQEAAANQTRQEKWMQMAKDAWNNKEKIEPFQFFPESFVKLNNVEFALQQLDKLEHEMNVDACAEVIQRHTPPAAMKRQRINNFVFSIKIVEGEDLKACDINGLSDPYVVLGDEFQKRLAKTRVIYQTLNPRWDETVDVTTQGPLNIIATIWDWDTLGKHDYVGRTSLKLDPSHFRDFLPKEFWLDLDTQGRLLLRVSMEGERDDIQFYFGKSFRTLKRTEGDMTRRITDKLSAYIHHCLSRRALRSLLSRGINMSAVSNYFSRIRPASSMMQAPTAADVTNALKPLFTYFDDNFAIMNETLTRPAMIMVMTRLWKEVLVTIESLLVPPLSDKPSQQHPLTQQELDIVYKWLELLFDFFNAADEETGEANGVPTDMLKSPKYHDIQSLNFFYFETTENLVRESERMANATLQRQQQAQRSRASAPALLASPAFGGPTGLMGVTSTRRSKSIMLSRNLGTMRKAKEEKRREAQAEPNDDMILRILRMRPEAERYLKDRSRQKERLAAAAAAQLIVQQSLLSGGGRMIGSLPRR